MLCKSCLQDKEPSAFYASNRTKCKECVKEAVRTNRLENIEQLIEAFVDAAAHLVAAASAYEKHASRSRHLKPRAVADALFTTRINDFKQAAARAQAACQKLKETK